MRLISTAGRVIVHYLRAHWLVGLYCTRRATLKLGALALHANE